MNAKKRYGFILISVILLTMCYFWGSKFREKGHRHKQKILRKSYIKEYLNSDISSPKVVPSSRRMFNNSFCNMESCFDFSKCAGRPFKVFVYPEDENVPPSSSYLKILDFTEKLPLRDLICVTPKRKSAMLRLPGGEPASVSLPSPRAETVSPTNLLNLAKY